MQTFPAQLLMADTANGVQLVDICDYPEAEMMNPADFLGSLKSLDDGETIFTQVLPAGTDGNWEKIDTEYGIH